MGKISKKVQASDPMYPPAIANFLKVCALMCVNPNKKLKYE